MCLVNGYEAHLHVLQLCLKQLRSDAFRRYVEQLGASEDAVVKCGHNLPLRFSSVYCCRNDASASEVVHLVFHQGDKRCYHDARALFGESRHLESQRLASSCRHQSQGVVALCYASDYIALDASEVRVSPVVMENL